MNLIDTINRFGALHDEPPVERVDYVHPPMSFSASTLAFSARAIASDPHLARQMGVAEDDIVAALRACGGV